MKQSTNKKTTSQSIVYTAHRGQKIPIISRTILPEKIAEFYNPSHLKHIKLTTKLSVRKLRACYVSSQGEKEK